VTVAQRERAALVETMRNVGPDAPTLCEGWKTRDLAAHLVIREYRIDASPGILIPFFAGHTEKVQNEVAEQTEWDQLLDKVASGPPIYSPLKLLDPVANIGEMFIHHEDVRRAQPSWTPRTLEPALAKSLRRTLPRAAYPGGQDSAGHRPGPGRHGDRGARGAAAVRGGPQGPSRLRRRCVGR
jgi:uncharacterized protein (TIGR03085 family)